MLPTLRGRIEDISLGVVDRRERLSTREALLRGSGWNVYHRVFRAGEICGIRAWLGGIFLGW